MKGGEALIGGLAERAFERRNECAQRLHFVVAKIVDAELPVWRCRLRRGKNAINDVINVGEVSFHIAVVEEGDGFVLKNGFGKLKQRHVGASPWSVYGEESQGGRRNIEEMDVSLRDDFAGAFGCSIEGKGFFERILDAEGKSVVAAIYGGRRCKHEMLECAALPDAPGEFADNDLSLQVGACVGEGVIKGITHAGLCRHMNDGVDVVFSVREFANDDLVGDVAFEEGEILMLPETFQPCVFEFRIVVCVEVIDADDLLATLEQSF